MTLLISHIGPGSNMIDFVLKRERDFVFEFQPVAIIVYSYCDSGTELV